MNFWQMTKQYCLSPDTVKLITLEQVWIWGQLCEIGCCLAKRRIILLEMMPYDALMIGFPDHVIGNRIKLIRNSPFYAVKTARSR